MKERKTFRCDFKLCQDRDREFEIRMNENCYEVGSPMYELAKAWPYPFPPLMELDTLKQLIENYNLTEEDLEEISRHQREFVRLAGKYLKEGRITAEALAGPAMESN
jgi:hypothetical protein